MAAPIQGALFDKDGTLFDFEATWTGWAAGMLLEFSDGDAARAGELGAHIGYDFGARQFRRDSPVIAGTPEDIAAALIPAVPDIAPDDLIERMNAGAARAPQVEVVPLARLLPELRGLGLRLGVATNDAEAPARAHLASVGQEQGFDFIAGYDSGYGGKPAPGMCLGFAAAVGLAPQHVLMVGDSLHDMQAGRAAGMRTVAVLTGMASEAELAPLADVVLPDIGHLPGWIGAGQ